MYDEILNNRYVLKEKIGIGAFSDIFVALDTERSNFKVAIKLDNDNKGYGAGCGNKGTKGSGVRNSNRFLIEYEVYQILNSKDCIGFVQCYSLEKKDARYFLVMDLLYKNLQQLFEICQQNFSLKTVLYIAIEAINRLETLHKINYVYRDIKPENFMIGFPGTKDFRTIFLIDFGLAKEFRNPSSLEHIPPSERKRITGTVDYMSLNAHSNNELSRRDDLESLGYLLVYFLQKKLPWSVLLEGQIFNMFPREQCAKIGSMKDSLTPEELFDGHPEAFSYFLKYAKHLKFDEEPEYEMLREKFRKVFKKMNIIDDGIFDWEIDQDNQNDSINPY